VPSEDLRCARLGDGAVVRGHLGRAHALPHEHRGIVEVEKRDVVLERDRGQSERQAPADEIDGFERGPHEPLDLLRDCGDGLDGEVEAAVERRIVVAAVSLQHAREPERAAPGTRPGGPVPSKAAKEDHA
jgi:hypothetical protein